MSDKEKNVQIPVSVFDAIIDLLLFRLTLKDHYKEKFSEKLEQVLDVLSEKQSRLIRHNAYSVMVTTKNQDELERAKFNYHYFKEH